MNRSYSLPKKVERVFDIMVGILIFVDEYKKCENLQETYELLKICLKKIE